MFVNDSKCLAKDAREKENAHERKAALLLFSLQQHGEKKAATMLEEKYASGGFFLQRRGASWFFLIYWLTVATLACPLLWFGATLAWPPVGNALAVQSYQQGQCTILTKNIRVYSSSNEATGADDYQYAPDFTFFVYDASHKSFPGQGYGIDQGLQQDHTSAQTVLNQYQIGKTFPCWYDTANPSHAILTRDVTEWILLLPGSIMLLIGLGILSGGIRLAKMFRV